MTTAAVDDGEGDGARIPAADALADVDDSTALIALLGARLDRLRAATNNAAGIRRLLIAERAQQDSAPLTCTASYVDVRELT